MRLRSRSAASVTRGQTNVVEVRLGPTASIAGRFVQRDLLTPVTFAQVAVGADEAGGVEDPAIHQLLQAPLADRVEHGGAAQGVQVAVGVEAQLRRAVVAAGQRLAGVAERLEVADGVGVLQGGHERTGWDSWQGIA